MPKGTKVSNCVEDLKKRGEGVNPYAVCQASTHQSYATGRKIKSLRAKYSRKCLGGGECRCRKCRS